MTSFAGLYVFEREIINGFAATERIPDICKALGYEPEF